MRFGDGLEGGEDCGGGVGVGFWLGVDEVVEHRGEVFAAFFFYILDGGGFGDGSDGAEIGVEDQFVD